MLKPYFKTIEEEEADFTIIKSREKALRQSLKEVFPEKIDAQLSLGDLGKACIRAFIYLSKDVTEKETKEAIRALLKLYKKAERFFRENEGTFAWRSEEEKEDSFGKYSELVFIENASQQSCTIKKVKKEIEVYETDCTNKEIMG